MGSEVRKLVFGGYPATNVLASDIRQEFIDLGYDLYEDRQTCGIRFFQDDLFSLLSAGVPKPTSTDSLSRPGLSQVSRLSDLVGRVNHIYLGALFHLYTEDTQLAIALIVGTVLKREEGSVVFGRHQGHEEEG